MTLAELGPGEIFGEISLLDQSGASASIVAAEDVLIDFVSHSELERLLKKSPRLAAKFHRGLALASRLRQSSALIPILMKSARDRQDEDSG